MNGTETITMPSEWEILMRLRALPELFAAIAESTLSEFPLQQELRQRFPEELIPPALTLADLRRKAAKKFTQASQLWPDRQSLEQATHETIAAYKALRFFERTSPDDHIADYCTGIGGDAIALAKKRRVITVDADPVRLLKTRWNAEQYQVAGNLSACCARVEHLATSPPAKWVHVDPDRRTGTRGTGTRALRLEQVAPSLEFLQQIPEQFRGGAIKVSPASNFGGKFPRTEAELISLNGECKEATLWFGELRGEFPWRATVLPAGETIAGHPLDAYALRDTLQEYLYDPDPAVVRAGLVDLLAEKLNLARLDDAEEYLTGDQLVSSPFVSAFRVLNNLPNNPKQYRKAIRQREWGQVEIKCRHIPIQAETVRRKLPLEGTAPGVLVFVRVLGKARAVLCERLTNSPDHD